MADRASPAARNIYYNFSSDRSSKLVCPSACVCRVAPQPHHRCTAEWTDTGRVLCACVHSTSLMR